MFFLLSPRSGAIALILLLFAVVLSLELSTPKEYVFGYLYTGPLLLVNARFGRAATFYATRIAACLTLLNLWFPEMGTISPSTLANRLIVVVALLVTGFLSERTRNAREAIAREQERLKTKERLLEMQEDFASTLTHDLKTPLLGAIEALEAYRQEKFGAVTETQSKILTILLRGHRDSLLLVETLLDVYRNERAGLSLKLAPLDLAVLVEECLASLAHLAATYQVYLVANYGDSDFRRRLRVSGDKLQLQRVLTNLIVNAVNHSRRGARIEVCLESGISAHTVKIIDNGSGITAGELPRLFDRFYQSDSDRQARGTGLGLYLSRQIIEAHGGTIWAENRSSSRGAVFAFRLPAYTP